MRLLRLLTTIGDRHPWCLIIFARRSICFMGCLFGFFGCGLSADISTISSCAQWTFIPLGGLFRFGGGFFCARSTVSDACTPARLEDMGVYPNTRAVRPWGLNALSTTKALN